MNHKMADFVQELALLKKYAATDPEFQMEWALNCLRQKYAMTGLGGDALDVRPDRGVAASFEVKPQALK